MKYVSALPIVVFALLYQSAAYRGGLQAEDFEVCWALAAIVNSGFSFMWDLTMDWGLLQPSSFKDKSLCLRPVLVLRGVFGFYYAAILWNGVGRSLWTLRWSPEAKLLLGALCLTNLQQAAEVVRRCLWSILRVEWECIRRGIHGSDRPRQVFRT